MTPPIAHDSLSRVTLGQTSSAISSVTPATPDALGFLTLNMASTPDGTGPVHNILIEDDSFVVEDG